MGSMPLEGVKVLDFTWWGAGPFFTKFLGDFGATVVKVESRKRIDLTRLSSPYCGGKMDVDTSALFIQANTSKLSITLDFSLPRGKNLIMKLVKWADVVAENFSAGFMQRAGLGYEELRRVKPDIIMISASCLGQTGEHSDLRGHALVGTALAGHYHLTGYPNGAPMTSTTIAMADYFQPMMGVVAIIAALEHRKCSREGQYIDLSQTEVMHHYMTLAELEMQANHSSPSRNGNRHPQAAPHDVFRCKGSDRWIAIAVFTQDEWRGLCDAMGTPPWCQEERFATLSGRKKNEDELGRLITAWTSNLDGETAMSHLQSHGVPSGVVQNAQDLLERDLQAKARELFPVMPHPVVGSCIHPVPPFKLSKSPGNIKTSPLLGEHNEYVFCKLLDMSNEEFTEAVKEGVIR